MNSDTIREKFEALRIEKGIKIVDVCDSLNISRQAFNAYFKRSINLATLEKLAAIVGVEAWELLKPSEDGNQDKPQKTPEILCPYCGKPLQIVPITNEDI